MNKNLKILIGILVLLPTIMWGQSKPQSEFIRKSNNTVIQTEKDSMVVEYETLMKIARKYGVEKNFSWESKDAKANLKNLKRLS